MHHSTIWWVSGFCSIRSVGSSAASRCKPDRQLVLVRLRMRLYGDRQQRLGHRPRLEQQWIRLVGERVAGLRPGQPPDRAQIARDHGRRRSLLPCPAGTTACRCARPRRGRRGVFCVTEEGREMARHVNRRVGPDGAGEHPHQADPADVRVRRRLHHLGEQRSVRIAGQALARYAVRGEHLGQRVLRRRREPAGRDLEQFERADAGAAADRDHREERAARDRSLEIVDQHRPGRSPRRRGSAPSATRPRTPR